jgi:hypothetical protein
MSTGSGPVFEVDPWTHRIGGLVTRWPRLFKRLGDLETRMLDDALDGVIVDRPIYVAGLARAGSTLLLEFLARHPSVAAHRYRDFPLLHTPWLWNRFLDRAARKAVPPAERSHRDGIVVDADSPEAFEEVLWMAFFAHLHDHRYSAVLDAETEHPEFEAFYGDHIRKLLALRSGRRYLAKGNYNVTRLEYLQSLFADARFVVPIRDPVWHIASLMKQHRLFCEGQRADPRARAHLERVGHFEFGVDRRPINTGDTAAAEHVARLWSEGREVEGWARHWSHLYGYVADRLEARPELRAATLVVNYERLCREPRETIAELFEHCGLEAAADLLDAAAGRVRFPTYYAPQFSDRDLELIAATTAETAARFGMRTDVTSARERHIG